MNAPYVCVRCRANLRLQLVRPGRFYRRSFVSLSEAKQDQQQEEELLQRAETEYSQAPEQAVQGRYSGRKLSPKSDSQDKLLGQLFEAGRVAQQSNGRHIKPQPIPRAWTSDDFNAERVKQYEERPDGLYDLLRQAQIIEGEMANAPMEPLPRKFVQSILERLSQTLLNNRPSQETLDILQELVPERARLSSFERLTLERSPVLDQLYKRILWKAVAKNGDPREVSITLLVQRYAEAGLMKPLRLHNAFVVALKTVATILYDENGNKDVAAQILGDVFQVWKFMLHEFTKPDSNGGEETGEWTHLPTAEDIQENAATVPPSFVKKFSHLFPGPYNTQAAPLFANNVLVTLFCYQLLRRQGKLQKELIDEVGPFTRTVGQIAFTTNRLNMMLANKSDLLRYFGERAVPEWSQFSRMIREDLLEQDLPTGGTTFDSGPKITKVGVVRREDFETKTDTLFADLRKATKEMDIRFITKLWKIHSQQTNEKDERYTQMMYAEFLWSFVKVVKIDQAIEVWLTMKKKGIQPTISHWTAMLEACGKHRDLESLLSIWDQLRRSDQIISNTAWTTYVNSLFQCKEWRVAVKAIKDLGDAWDSQASKIKDIPDVKGLEDDYKPSMIPINAALGGLYSLRKPDAAEAVLAYARNRGLAPTIETYNIRLSPAVRRSDPEGTEQVLAELRNSNLTPDVVTLTILVDGMFRNRNSAFWSQSPEEQCGVVNKVLDDMDAAGLAPNAHTYATILHSLLLALDPNLPAAQVILKRMEQVGLRASPHICAILVQHYFSASPPNLAAVEALWQRMESQKTSADHVFFDRVIENYARLGRTKEVLYFLRMMPSRGKIPGWLAMVAALRAMVQNGEYETANTVVQTVEREQGFVRMGIRRGWRGEAEWKGLVAALRNEGAIEPAEERKEKEVQ